MSLDPISTEPLLLSEEEKTYLLYFATGDLNVQTHGRKIRTMVGTTHPLMLEHVLNTLGPYGRNTVYPTTNPTGYCWRLACDLPLEFEFLKTKALVAPGSEGNSAELFEGLSGFGDAEGYVGLSNSRGLARGRFKVSSRIPKIIESFRERLESRGFGANVSSVFKNGAPQHELEVNGTNAVKLLPLLKLRHPEKIAAKEILLEYHGNSWTVAERVYRRFSERIKRQRDEFVKLAEIAHGIWPMRKAQRLEELDWMARLAKTMRSEGLRINQVMKQSRSQRTVYRYLARA